METFIFKLAVAAIPLIVLVASVPIITILSKHHTHLPLSSHRTRRNVLRPLMQRYIKRRFPCRDVMLFYWS
jgi:hypothetical protein